MSTAADAYLEAQVLTASPVKLHLLVIDGGIRAALRARSAILASNWEQMNLQLTRSRDCVAELLAGLKSDAAPELTESLKGLFVFVLRNLALADAERSIDRIDDALKVLAIHRETWKEVCAMGDSVITVAPESSSTSQTLAAVNAPHTGFSETAARSWTA